MKPSQKEGGSAQ